MTETAPLYVHIPAFGKWVTHDGQSFDTEQEASLHANSASIDQQVKDFMAYVEANADALFTLRGKRESAGRDGSLRPARPPRPLSTQAMQATMTRMEKVARMVFAYQAM